MVCAYKNVMSIDSNTAQGNMLDLILYVKVKEIINSTE